MGGGERDYIMIDFENFDFKKLDIKKLAEEFKNFGKMLLTAEEVISKAQAGESLAGAKLFGLDLSGANLRGVSLEEAMIFKTSLKEIGRASCRERV